MKHHATAAAILVGIRANGRGLPNDSIAYDAISQLVASSGEDSASTSGDAAVRQRGDDGVRMRVSSATYRYRYFAVRSGL